MKNRDEQKCRDFVIHETEIDLTWVLIGKANSREKNSVLTFGMVDDYVMWNAGKIIEIKTTIVMLLNKRGRYLQRPWFVEGWDQTWALLPGSHSAPNRVDFSKSYHRYRYLNKREFNRSLQFVVGVHQVVEETAFVRSRQSCDTEF